METAIPFSDKVIQDMVIESVEKVFSTMLSTKIAFVKAIPLSRGVQKSEFKLINTTQPLVASSVGFIGNINRVMFLYQEEDLSIKLSEAFLGLTYDEILEEGHETINDTLSEMANITVGTFKNKLCDLGYNCRLTIPSILRGNDLTIEVPENSAVKRICFEFDVLDSTYMVDLLVKPID